MYENYSRRSNCMPHQVAPPMTFRNPTPCMWTPSSCSNSHAYQWTPPMTPTQINSVHSPLRSVCMMQVQSPMSKYDQSTGWPGQFVSTPRSAKEQRFVCTNNISHEQMFGYTNVHTLSTNMHTESVNSLRSSPGNRTTHGLLQHIGNLSMNGMENRSERAGGCAYHIPPPSRWLHSSVGRGGIRSPSGETQ